MSKHLLIALLFIIAFNKAAYSQGPIKPLQTSEMKMAFIDTSAFAEGIAEYNLELKKLETEFQPVTKELQELNNNILKFNDDLKAKAGSIDRNAYKQQLDSLESLKQEFNYKEEKFRLSLQRRSNTVLGPVKGKILEYLQKYAASHNIAATFDISVLSQNGLLQFSSAINITDDFIKEYNKQFPIKN
jgi:Skp family chaperone for outer membrane proteins